MKILAIDQSSAVLGVSFFENDTPAFYSKIKISKFDNINLKIHNIKTLTEELYLKFVPDIITFEDIQQQMNVNTYKVLAELLGVLIEFCIEENIDYKVVHPKTWKSYCGIKGKKREEQKLNTILFVEQKFGIKVSEDEADSICLGYYTLNNLQTTLDLKKKIPKSKGKNELKEKEALLALKESLLAIEKARLSGSPSYSLKEVKNQRKQMQNKA